MDSTILLLGDIFIRKERVLNLTDSNKDVYSSAVSQEIQSCDYVFANLECALPKEPTLNKHKTSLITCPEILDALKGITGYNLANNHIMDSGINGVFDTIDEIKKRGKDYWGFGRNIDQARKPKVFQAGNHTFSVLSYSCLSTNGENYAFVDQPGVTPLATQLIEEDIKKAKDISDFVLVSLHWGIENVIFPTIDQIAIAHKIIDSGADLIWGHHPHIIQPFEFYKGKLIFFSLGNFIFTDFDNENSAELRPYPGKEVFDSKKLESLGLRIKIDEKEKRLIVSDILAFRFEQMEMVKSIKVSDLSVNLNEANEYLKKYISGHEKLLTNISNPDICVEFNGKIFQNRYRNLPINFHRKNNFATRVIDKVKNFLKWTDK